MRHLHKTLATAAALLAFPVAVFAVDAPLSVEQKHLREETARIFAIELASRDTIAIQSLDQGSADNYRVTLERLGPKGPQKCVLDIAVKAQSAASPSATPNPSLLAVNCTAVDAFHPSRSLVGN